METFFTQLVKRNGKAVYVRKAEEELFKKFIEAQPEGALINMLCDAGELGLLSQLSRIHKNIGTISKETGDSFDNVKKEVKRRSGLYQGNELKSFAICTKEELDLAMETTIELGEFVGINLR